MLHSAHHGLGRRLVSGYEGQFSFLSKHEGMFIVFINITSHLLRQWENWRDVVCGGWGKMIILSHWLYSALSRGVQGRKGGRENGIPTLASSSSSSPSLTYPSLLVSSSSLPQYVQYVPQLSVVRRTLPPSSAWSD